MSTVEEQKAAARRAIDRFRSSKASSTLSAQQAATARERPVPSLICVSKVKMPPPDDTDARAHLLEAVANISSDVEAFTLPKYGSFEGEWLGRLQHPGQADLSDKQKFDLLTKERKSDLTIMYVHGGAYSFGSPVTARPVTIPLVSLTGGRCFALKYRLVPQVQALSQQLDAFVAYLSLLYPPPEAFHSPVSPECLVLAGDSCGAVLNLFILQTVLQLQRQQKSTTPMIRWYGRLVQVPMPIGITSLSISADHLLCLPSYSKNLEYDMMNDVPPYRGPSGQIDEIWPSNPPRADSSCELSAMSSVVTNPCIADSWRGSPPMYFACGEERLADASKLLAQQAAPDGVLVQFEEYAIMPHIFALMLPQVAQTDRCLRTWANFMQDCYEGKRKDSHAVRVEPGRLEVQILDLGELVNFTRDDARAMMKARQRQTRVWEGPEASGNLTKL